MENGAFHPQDDTDSISDDVFHDVQEETDMLQKERFDSSHQNPNIIDFLQSEPPHVCSKASSSTRDCL